MKNIKLTIIIIVVFIISTIISVYYLYNGNKILVNFKILSVTNEYTEYKIVYSKVKAADHYVINIHDEDDLKVYEETTTDTEVTLDLSGLIYDTEYSLMIYAYDSAGDYRPCEEEYLFTFREPTIENDGILLNDEDYILSIPGEIEGKNYKIKILKNNEEIVYEDINENEYTISKTLYNGEEVFLNVYLMVNDKVVDEIELFNNMNPITDITIDNIEEGEVIAYNDFTVNINGGDNASNYIISIYKDKKLIKSTSTTKKSVVLSKNLFEVSSNYRIEIKAKYEDYEKDASVSFTMGDQVQLKPVYISNNWKYVKSGTKITLTSPDNAKIYYTLDGKNPESFGTLYTEPIEITENVTLKTVAVQEGYANSIVSEYNINVGEKTNLKVYLSPSNQHANIGVTEVGYTNEMDEMNDLTDYIEERLESYGVTVYRNNPAGNINTWNKDSNYYGVDFKIAIHSNASDNHDVYGIETWIYQESSATYSIANIIQESLMSIYPYSDLEGANRGVKYANGALGEANDNYIPFGILVEVAHHDYKDDALWIMQNKKVIGYNIADSILKYYQIID